MATIEISDDDNSFNGPSCSKTEFNCHKEMFSSDDEDILGLEEFERDTTSLPSSHQTNNSKITVILSSDDEENSLATKKKNEAIKKLFPSRKVPNTSSVSSKKSAIKALFPSTSKNESDTIAESFDVKMTNLSESNLKSQESPKSVISRMIEGVNVMLPVNPYGSQIALMSKIITGMKKRENCLLESPTGSGKTLALLCGALAWQQFEQNRISQEQVQQYFTQHPELKQEGVSEYISQPIEQKTDVTPEKLFNKTSFGEKSIYSKPDQNGESSTSKRQEKTVYREDSQEETNNLVSIHKRPRLGSVENAEGNKTPENLPGTPEKREPPETPDNVRLPIIYYGVRTHSQLKQVVKEFKRTLYCGKAKMTILSSREKSCIKEFNNNMWSSRDDMCRACIKPYKSNSNRTEKTHCEYYDNRTALHHGSLPPAFDLEDLMEIGQEKRACPYFGAKLMAKNSQIVFCPYNYIIDPIIRDSMSINLENNVVIIDEAHNIEKICRESASIDIARSQIQNSLKELQTVAASRYANQGIYVDDLVKTLKNWDDWFHNQIPLISNERVDNNEAQYKWKDAQHFIESLNNHNIGNKHYNEFKLNCENLCRRLREDPRTLLEVTQATGKLLESMAVKLGYLFRNECQHVDDFKPVLVRQIQRKNHSITKYDWRASSFNESIAKESLSLSLLCMNPALVMRELQAARCIALTSGTLTPMDSLHSELDTKFPHCVTPNHVIPRDRVWIGTLDGDARGPQQFTARQLEKPATRQALGEYIVRVCELTPHGVLCFLPSYSALCHLEKEWQTTGLWRKMEELKYVFCEHRNVRNHNNIMEDFYQCVGTTKGALLFAVYRGKVSEGMDFKDHQARAVICVGVPFPSNFDTDNKAKMEYNDKYSKTRGLLRGQDWLRVQAYRALNQAVGRCVRHRGDWGAVLLVDSRYQLQHYTQHLSKWVKIFLGNNHHTYESLLSYPNGLAAFMQRMQISDEEDNCKMES